MSARPQTAEAAIAVIARECPHWDLDAQGVRLRRSTGPWAVWVNPVPTSEREFSVHVTCVAPDGLSFSVCESWDDPDVDDIPGLLAALGAPVLTTVPAQDGEAAS